MPVRSHIAGIGTTVVMGTAVVLRGIGGDLIPLPSRFVAKSMSKTLLSPWVIYLCVQYRIIHVELTAIHDLYQFGSIIKCVYLVHSILIQIRSTTMLTMLLSFV